MQLLLLLKQTAESSDRALVLNLGDERSLIELGSCVELVHAHHSENPIEWTLEWEIPRDSRLRRAATSADRMATPGSLRFAAAVSSNGSGRVILERFEYAFGGKALQMRKNEDGRYELSAEPDNVLQRQRGRPPHVAESVKCYGFPDALAAQYRDEGLFADLQLEFENLFSRV